MMARAGTKSRERSKASGTPASLTSSGEKREMHSRPEAMFSQNASTLFARGKRPAIPMTAI
jgi:hypothetical protein